MSDVCVCVYACSMHGVCAVCYVLCACANVCGLWLCARLLCCVCLCVVVEFIVCV